MKRILITLLAASLFAPLTAVQAIPVTWILKDVRFDDGGAAVGSFTYDADTNSYVDLSISTSGVLEYHYDISGLVAFVDFGFNANTGSRANGEGFLQLIALSSLTNAGGSIALGKVGNFSSFESTYRNGSVFTAPDSRLLVSGTITAVTEPGTLAVLGFGLLGIGCVQRRKRAACGELYSSELISSTIPGSASAS